MPRILLGLLSFGLMHAAFAAEFETRPHHDYINFYKPIPDSEMPTSQQQFFAGLPAGKQVFDAPEQHRIHDYQWHSKGNYQLGFTDTFMIRGLVLSKREYVDDQKSDIAPFDLVLGWGDMSDPKIIKEIDIRQNRRFYFWHVQDFPIPRKEIELSSTNLHLIPDNQNISQQLAKLHRGDVVSLVGYLTDVKDVKDGSNFIWVTSRSRKDSGDGACEIVLIKQMSVIKHLGH